MPPTLQEVRQIRLNDVLNTHRLLAERISLALDPELILDSDIDEGTLVSLRKEVNELTDRTKREDVRLLCCIDNFPSDSLFKIRALLTRYGKADDVHDGLAVMKTQLGAPNESNSNDDLDFPFAILGSGSRPATRQPAHAGPSRTGSGGGLRPQPADEGLEPASGPQRRTPSTRETREEAIASPRRRLVLPSDCQNFDVVFLPFKSDLPMKLPDQALRVAQLSLQSLGLVFHVRLPRQERAVQKYFDCQVKSFCEDQQITLKSGVVEGITDWVLMKRISRKGTLEPAVLAPSDFNVATLMGSKLLPTLPNYLSEDGTRKVLLIAPISASLKGAINLPDVKIPQMSHHCHCSRLDAAINSRIGQCEGSCPKVPVSDTVSSSRRAATGRTL
ncbi:hypothetical protein FB451DRAFT_1222037, partial [Mycena latifolia]